MQRMSRESDMTHLRQIVRRMGMGAAAVALTLSAAVSAPAVTRADDFVIGYVMVGPREDKGWNEAHLRASEYVEKMIPGTKSIILDKFNTADRPNVTMEQVVENMVSEGAKIIFTTSDEMGADTIKVAEQYPDVTFIHISGDAVHKNVAPKNLGNIMGRMEYGKMIAGCAAALETTSGKIGYLGPLINDETRRLVASSYLGARYCYETYRKEDPATLSFEVKWIGFWFNIPGVTLDPVVTTESLINAGADVMLSGIDTPEATTVSAQYAEKGTTIAVLPYDYEKACELAEDICLGTAFFNWGPSYVATVKQVQAGTWEQSWDWNAPDWEDLNNTDTTAIGFVKGKALDAEQSKTLDTFIAGLADGSINLFTGPLNYQDGTVFLKEGEVATDDQIWYLPQLLEGMTGASKSE